MTQSSFDSKGLQLPGGPWIEVGHNQENVWTRWALSESADDGRSIRSAQFDYFGAPEDMLAAADTLAELAGAMRDQANRALDFKAQLREVTF